VLNLAIRAEAQKVLIFSHGGIAMPLFRIFNNEPDVRSFTTGQVIFNEGQPSEGLMFAVLEGEVELVRGGRVLATNPVGGVFGEMGLLDHAPRSASATAKTDCRVAAITEQRFTKLVSQNPLFALDMMRLLSERLRHDLES
jgi:CRP/FNR family transcriptional regulator, cyclic AMP receptor protein